MAKVTRRRFLQWSSGAALGAAAVAQGCATTVPAAAPQQVYSGKRTASDKVVVGLIGCAGRGMSLLSGFRNEDDVEIAAVCDVYEPHAEQALSWLDQRATGYSDYREMLDRQDLDAVIVATPPHWHPLQTIHACESGLDVYVEKPLALTPLESRAMLNAAQRHNRVTQVGTQIHANENYHRVVEIVRSGILGDISSVRVVLTMNDAPDGLGHPPDETPPDNLDWDMWLGPLPELSFNWAKFENGHHRYFKELVGSWIHEMGPHLVDLPMWALSPGAPVSVASMGGKYVVNDISTVPDTMETIFEYPDFVMNWTNSSGNSHGLQFHEGSNIRRRIGISFHGMNGTLLADYDNREIISEGDRLDENDLPEPTLPRSPGHIREFVEAVKTRQQPSCSIENHYPVALALNLGQLSLDVGRRINWDADNEQVIGDAEANQRLAPEYRDPWRLPV